MAVTPWTSATVAKADVDAKIRDQTEDESITPGLHADAEWASIDAIFGRLPLDGSQAMTGNLDVGGNELADAAIGPVIRRTAADGTNVTHSPSADTDVARFAALQAAFTAAAADDADQVIETVNITADAGANTLAISGDNNIVWKAKNTKITRTDSSDYVVYVTATGDVTIEGVDLDGGENESGSGTWTDRGDIFKATPAVDNLILRNCSMNEAPTGTGGGTTAHSCDSDAINTYFENVTTLNPSYCSLRCGGQFMKCTGWRSEIHTVHGRSKIRHWESVSRAIASGTAQVGGSTTSIKLAAGASSTDNYYVGYQVGVAFSGQTITNVSIGATVTVTIAGHGFVNGTIVDIDDITGTVGTDPSNGLNGNQYTISAVTTDTFVLDGADTSGLVYSGNGTATPVSQLGQIIAYDGTTKIATIEEAWTLAPDATSTYEVRTRPTYEFYNTTWKTSTTDPVNGGNFDNATTRPLYDIKSILFDGWTIDSMTCTDITHGSLMKIEDVRRVDIKNVIHRGPNLSNGQRYGLSINTIDETNLENISTPTCLRILTTTGPVNMTNCHFGNSNQTFTAPFYNAEGGSRITGRMHWKNVHFEGISGNQCFTGTPSADQQIVMDNVRFSWNLAAAKYFTWNYSPSTDNFIYEGAGLILDEAADTTNIYLSNSPSANIQLTSLGRGVLGFGIRNFYGRDGNVAVTGYGTGVGEHAIPAWSTNTWFASVTGNEGDRILNLDEGNSYHKPGWIHDGTGWVEMPGDFKADGSVAMTGDLDLGGKELADAAIGPVIRRTSADGATNVTHEPSADTDVARFAAIKAAFAAAGDGDIIETVNIVADASTVIDEVSYINLDLGSTANLTWIAHNTVIQRSTVGSDYMVKWAGTGTLEIIGLELDGGESVRAEADWTARRGVLFGALGTSGTVILRDCYFHSGPASHNDNQSNVEAWSEYFYAYDCRFEDPGTGADLNPGRCFRVKASRYTELNNCVLSIGVAHGFGNRWMTLDNVNATPWYDQVLKINGGLWYASNDDQIVTTVIDAATNSVGPAQVLIDGLTIINEGWLATNSPAIKITGFDTHVVIENVLHSGDNMLFDPVFINMAGSSETSSLTVRNCQSPGTITPGACPVKIYDSKFGVLADGTDPEKLTLDVAPATIWAAGDTITGTTSGATATVIRAESITVYKIRNRSGTFNVNEEVSNGTYPATQTALAIEGYLQSSFGGVNAPTIKDLYLENTSFRGLKNDNGLYQNLNSPWQPGNRVRFKNVEFIWNKTGGRAWLMAALENSTRFAGTGLFIDNISPLQNYPVHLALSEQLRLGCSAMTDDGMTLAYGRHVESRYARLIVSSPLPKALQNGMPLTGGTSTETCRIIERKSDTEYQVDRITGTFTASETLNGDLVYQQDETSYDNSPPTEGVFVGGDGDSGTPYAAGNIINLSNGSQITVDAVDGNGDVTQFTVNTKNATTSAEDGVQLTQSSTTGSGVGFTLTPGPDNVFTATYSSLTDYSNLSTGYNGGNNSFTMPPVAELPDAYGVLGMRILNLDASNNSEHQPGWIHDGANFVEMPGDFKADGSVAMTGDLVLSTGDTAGKVTVQVHSATDTLTADECYGKIHYVDTAATLNLPPVVSGMSLTVITQGAIAVRVNPDDADSIRLDGAAEQTNGVDIVNTSTAGDICVCTFYEANGWFCATNGWSLGS